MSGGQCVRSFRHIKKKLKELNISWHPARGFLGLPDKYGPSLPSADLFSSAHLVRKCGQINPGGWGRLLVNTGSRTNLDHTETGSRLFIGLPHIRIAYAQKRIAEFKNQNKAGL